MLSFLGSAVFSNQAFTTLNCARFQLFSSGIFIELYEKIRPDFRYAMKVPADGEYVLTIERNTAMLISDKQYTPAALYELMDENYGVKFPPAHRLSYFYDLRSQLETQDLPFYFGAVLERVQKAGPDLSSAQRGDYFGEFTIEECELFKDNVYARILEALGFPE